MSGDERGYVLIAALAMLLSFGTLWLLAKWIWVPRLEWQNEQKTNRALTDAKNALVARSFSDRNTPGSLPCAAENSLPGVAKCPDDKSQPIIVGGFPWKTLGIPAPKNGVGDCIWMVVSAPMRSEIPATSRNVVPINPASNLGIEFNGSRYPALLVSPSPKAWTPGSNCSGNTADDIVNRDTWTVNLANVSQSNGVMPISMNDILRPVLRRVLQPLSLSCAHSIVKSYESPTPVSIAEIRNDYLSRSLLVNVVDTSIGGCNQVELCKEKLQKHNISWDDYTSKDENINRSKEIEAVAKCAQEIDDNATSPDACQAIEETLGQCSQYLAATRRPLLNEVRKMSSGTTKDKIISYLRAGSLSAGQCPIVPPELTETAPFWLCHNDWYRYLNYNEDKSVSVSLNSSPPFTCSIRQSDGVVTCN